MNTIHLKGNMHLENTEVTVDFNISSIIMSLISEERKLSILLEVLELLVKLGYKNIYIYFNFLPCV